MTNYVTMEREAYERLCSLVRESHSVSEGIDDANVATNSTYSSAKIQELLCAGSEIEDKVDEALAIAKGRNRAHVFATTEAMQTALADESNKGIWQVGDNLYIEESDASDWWIAEVLEEADTDTGYFYRIAPLESPDTVERVSSGSCNDLYVGGCVKTYYVSTAVTDRPPNGNYAWHITSYCSMLPTDTAYKNCTQIANFASSMDGNKTYVRHGRTSSGVMYWSGWAEVVTDIQVKETFSSIGDKYLKITFDGNDAAIILYARSRGTETGYATFLISNYRTGGERCRIQQLQGDYDFLRYVDELSTNTVLYLKMPVTAQYFDSWDVSATLLFGSMPSMEITDTYTGTELMSRHIPTEVDNVLQSEFLSLAGGDMNENARIVIQNNNYMAGFIAKCEDVSEAHLDGESIGIRNYAFPHAYSVMNPASIEIHDDNSETIITNTNITVAGNTINDNGFTIGDRTDGGNETGYSNTYINVINEYNAFFGINLWSNGGETDHNMYCFQADSFYAELYTGQPDLGNANAKWKDVYAESSQITTSDRREKTDITDLDDETIKDFIMSLKPSSYKFINSDSGRTHYGLIAQDVEETMDTLGMTSKDFAGFIKSPKTTVSEDNPREKVVVEGEYIYGLRYEEFIAPMIKMIQTQQKEIDELKSTVAMLSGNTQ